MTSRVITFASAKGGSGKTTIVASLAGFLSALGFRVLLVDCDEGTHGLTLMYLQEVNAARKTFGPEAKGVFEKSEYDPSGSFKPVMVPTPSGALLVPARFTFSEEDYADGRDPGSAFERRLEVLVEAGRESFDFVILDSQAGISDASRATMKSTISDLVVLVSEYDPMSNAGIERMKARLPVELDTMRTWVLLNKLLPEFVSKFSEFLTFARYLPPIPWSADVVRAYSRRRTAVNFESANQFTLAIMAVVRELLSEEQRPALDEWLERQTIRMRQPIYSQIEDLKKKMEFLTYERDRIAARSQTSSRAQSRFAFGIGVAAAAASTILGILISSGSTLTVFGFSLREALLVVAIGWIGTLTAFAVVYTGRQQKHAMLDDDYASLQSDLFEVNFRLSQLNELAASDLVELVRSRDDAHQLRQSA